MQKRQNGNHQRVADTGFRHIIAGSFCNTLIEGDGLLTGLTGVVCPFYTVGPENRADLCLFQQKKTKENFRCMGNYGNLQEQPPETCFTQLYVKHSPSIKYP